METDEIIRKLQERVERLEHDHSKLLLKVAMLAVAYCLSVLLNVL